MTLLWCCWQAGAVQVVADQVRALRGTGKKVYIHCTAGGAPTHTHLPCSFSWQVLPLSMQVISGGLLLMMDCCQGLKQLCGEHCPQAAPARQEPTCPGRRAGLRWLCACRPGARACYRAGIHVLVPRLRAE